MKNGFLRVATATPKLVLADPASNAREAVTLAKSAAKEKASLLVFPELSLSGKTAGDLFLQTALLSASEKALMLYMKETAELPLFSLIGLPVSYGGKLYNAAAAVYGGRLLGLVPKTVRSGKDIAEGRCFAKGPREATLISFAGQETLFGGALLFSAEGMPSLVIAVEFGSEGESLMPPALRLAASGATVILSPSATPELVGQCEKRRLSTAELSRRTRAAILLSEAGTGESGTDFIFGGQALIAECGDILREKPVFSKDALLFATLDTERITAERLREPAFGEGEAVAASRVSFRLPLREAPLDRDYAPSPFLPEGSEARLLRASLILDMAAHALAGRLERAHAKNAVIGLSGGLDSTLALLVAVRAFHLLSYPTSGILAVTMPGFGTTGRTRGNAETLAEALSVTLKTVPIGAAVIQHFMDIGHDPECYNVVYENAQARERTQILMDLANACGGLVIGTGDLSELALGWATYNGDHMSMYAVNAGIPKTMIRCLVAHEADRLENAGDENAAPVLRDILDTPVSPELLPPKDGEIAQCTEGIVGPYELHDFFLYYLLRFGFSPKKLYRIACHAFLDIYTPEVILGWLRVFLRRFITQQFKRSCLPDGVKIGSVGVSPRGDLMMPSDASLTLWQKELDEINA